MHNKNFCVRFRAHVSRTFVEMAMRGLTSALVEHFNHPQVVRQLALALAACPGKHWLEMLVNDDSGNLLLPDRLPRRPGALQITVLRSPNIHEIRAYNLLSMRARGEYLLFLQDDDLPPASGRWLSDALAAFAALPTLGLLGLLTGGSEPRRKRLINNVNDGE